MDRYDLEYVSNYYSSFIITDDFCLNKTLQGKVLKIIKNIVISKAAGIDRFPWRFFRDGVEVLSRSLYEISNL